MRVKISIHCILFVIGMALLVGKLSAEESASVLVDEVLAGGNTLLENYQPSLGVQTGNAFSRLYFDVFESKGLEFVISQNSQTMLLEIESSFSGLIGLSMAKKPHEEVSVAWTKLSDKLALASELTIASPGEISWQASFVSSLILVLREGVEALLIIALLLSYMRASGVADYQWVVKLGIVLAIVASVAVAVLLQMVFTSQTARQRELLEGIALLVASGLMVYVSHWLLSRKDAEKWQSFIKEALHRAVDGKKLWVLGSVAFFAVFREGAETVLFYTALVTDGKQSVDALVSGGVTALGLLFVLYFVFMYVSIKLPIKAFFTASAVLLYVLAVSFAGKGILEMQLAGWVTSTLVVGAPTVTWIGVFPTLESLVLQALLILLIPLGYLWSKRMTQGIRG